MAVDITIIQKRLFKKKITLATLQKISGSRFNYGFHNYHCVLKDYNEDKLLADTCIVFYSPDCIGRGINFIVSNDFKSCTLSLNYLCTKRDIEDFYFLIDAFCRELGTNEFSQDGSTLSLSDIPKCSKDLITFNLFHSRNALKEHDSLCIFSALRPYYVEPEIKEKLLSLDDDNEFNQFYEEFLHNKQSMDVYYATPLYYQRNDDNQKIGLFALTLNVTSVIPIEPTVSIFMNNLSNDELIWQVSLGKLNKKTKGYTKIGIVSFEDFKMVLNLKQATRFDDSTVIITIKPEHIDKLQPYIQFEE